MPVLKGKKNESSHTGYKLQFNKEAKHGNTPASKPKLG
jgi:hypothetical protein